MRLYPYDRRDAAAVVKDGKVALEHDLEFDKPQLITLEVAVDRDLAAARYTTEIEVRWTAPAAHAGPRGLDRTPKKGCP